ncbi:hypothetical protein DEDE109153_07765 [Deinococcus deserti]|uniref:HMA domain-containing protein n=1 Tax=Deinococcus deserti (strain DSM 17065 / CIP 109153 / LMG 22923 / VCD115) TaxID=546414 RepID=C1CWC5_DEIDV|nr:hypothetical protein [Deinococcus deserti]ACO46492.1 hypothetical protein Deide_15310 [Deinococcus deserti VCD115]
MSDPSTPARPTRVLLNVRLQNGDPVDAEVGRKAALYMSRQPGVLKAEGGMAGNLEVHYDAESVTLTDLTRAMAKAGLRVGIV